MIIKGIGATSHLDLHNCRLSKEMLEELVNNINNEKYAIRMGIEHDSSIMPIGKILSGKMLELEDGEYAVEIEQEIFEKLGTHTDSLNKIWYITGSYSDTRPFADAQIEKVDNIKVSIDPINFSQMGYEKLWNFYEQECQIDVECSMRKAVIPIPEIVITLMSGTFAVMVGKKIAEKMSEQVAEDVVKIYDLIKKVVIETLKYIKKDNRPVTYLVRESGESFLLELAVITEKPECLFEALSSEKICQIENEIDDFIKNFDVEIDKIQCLYDKESGKWEINYVSTKDGKVIGSEKCYKKTVELSKRMGTGLSIGMNVEFDK